MKHNREFEIAWQGLKPGPHTFMYEIDDRFMMEREAEHEFKNWDARVNVVFDKHESFFMLKFDIDGKVTVPCDRCGDDFELRLWDEFKLLIKLTGGDEAEMPEEEDDVVFIPRSETVIDISGWVYEFVMLSVPMQHIHPAGANGQPGCNEAALKLLGSLSDSEVHSADNVWKGLDALKDMATDGKLKKNNNKNKHNN